LPTRSGRDVLRSENVALTDRKSTTDCTTST
jgi:hypothetical protein